MRSDKSLSERAPLIDSSLFELTGAASRSSSLPTLDSVEQVHPLDQSNWYFKAIALVCSCLMSVGSHYASHMLNALKPTLMEELDISNLQFGLLTSASALINTVVPLFGGMFVDVFGTGWGAILSASLIMVGEMLTATATEVTSYPLMMFGRIIYGLGAGCIVTVQEAILARWFRGRGLALAIGFQLSMSRLASFLAVGTVTPIAELSGFYGTAFWISAAICAFSWLVMIAYIFMMRAMGIHDDASLSRKLHEKHTFTWVAPFRMSSTFWVICLLSFLFGLTWSPFMRITTDLVIERFGTDADIAAWQSSISLALPVVINPVLGLLIDKWGKRTWITGMSAVTQLISFFLVGFSLIHPTVGLVFFSISLALGPVAMITSITLITPTAWVGTALGLYKCASNIGSTIMEPLQGQVQDIYGSYEQVMVLLTACAVACLVACVPLTIMNYVYNNGILDVAEPARLVIIEKRKMNRETAIDMRENEENAPFPIPGIIWVSALLASLVVSWGLYLYFVILSSTD